MCRKAQAFDEAVEEWKQLVTDEGAEYDRVVEFDVETLDSASNLGNKPRYGNRHYCNSSGSG